MKTRTIEADNINEYLQFNPWTGHRTYIYDLVQRIEPNNIVELGSHYGCSLFTIAQAIKDKRLKSTVYAVDTWEGTGEIGAYDSTVYEIVKKTKEMYYSQVNIILLKMLFKDARKKIEEVLDKGIDLLHIDGSHEYNNVKEDFETWIDLMSENGIILFHDIGSGTNQGSEVYWNEIKNQYRYTLEFDYSWGLGIIFLDEKEYLEAIELLKDTNYQKVENRRSDQVAHKAADYYFEALKSRSYIKDLEEWNRIKEEHLKRWKTVVSGKEEYINQLEEEKKEVSKHLEGWKDVVEGKEKYISQLEEEKKEVSKHLEGWKDVVEGKEKYISQLEKEKEEVSKHLEGWKDVVEGKEKYINQLEEDKQKLSNYIETWKVLAEEKNRTNESLLDQLRQERDVLCTQTEEQEEYINILKKQVGDLEREKSEFENATFIQKVKFLLGGKKSE